MVFDQKEQDRIDKCKNREESLLTSIQIYDEKKEELMEEMKIIKKTSSLFAAFVQANCIEVFNVRYLELLQMQMRDSKDEEKTLRLKERMKIHESEKETLELMIAELDRDNDFNEVPPSEDIPKMRETMYKLKHFGERFKKICTMIEEQGKNRPPSIIPVPNFRCTGTISKKQAPIRPMY